LPLNSTAQRTAGAIFAQAGKPIAALLYPEVNGRTQRIAIHNSANTIVASVTGSSSNTAPLTLNFTPTVTGWYQIRVNSSTNKQAAQKVWVNVTYTAPANINTRVALRQARPTQEITEAQNSAPSVYPNPGNGNIRFDVGFIRHDQTIKASLYDVNGRLITEVNNGLSAIESSLSNTMKKQSAGLYFIRLNMGDKSYQLKYIKQ
jgi:alpha-amylase